MLCADTTSKHPWPQGVSEHRVCYRRGPRQQVGTVRHVQSLHPLPRWGLSARVLGLQGPVRTSQGACSSASPHGLSLHTILLHVQLQAQASFLVFSGRLAMEQFISKRSRLFFSSLLTAVEVKLCAGMWHPFFPFYLEIISNLLKICKHSYHFASCGVCWPLVSLPIGTEDYASSSVGTWAFSRVPERLLEWRE